jgi:cytochrome c553
MLPARNILYFKFKNLLYKSISMLGGFMMTIQSHSHTKNVFLAIIVFVNICCTTACVDQQDSVTKRGEEKTAACFPCHRKNGYPSTPNIPILTGQNRVYLIDAIEAYADGRRDHPLHKSFVAGLSNKDVEDIADYYSSQRRW